jgi:hypothetical protein
MLFLLYPEYMLHVVVLADLEYMRVHGYVQVAPMLDRPEEGLACRTS